MTSLDELPAADAVILDLAPSAVAELAGERLPARVARAYRRYKHGPGAFKVDLAVEGGVPWTAEPDPRAANVLGGDILPGANTPWQTTIRPRLSANPYSTGAPGLYICSAATPPGPGAHGICGYNAAEAVLRTL